VGLDKSPGLSYYYDEGRTSIVIALTENAPTISLDEARLARMLKALGNPVRFQIMKTLAERQTCITQEIVDSTPLAQSTVSQHLKVLREAGLIRGEIEGPATCYCIDPAAVRWLKEQLEGWLPDCCGPDSLQTETPGNSGAGCSCG
jgi:ArsR family transcriptional regulator, arsenate/arsenite/antimonite-responsive transcriptional repressor